MGEFGLSTVCLDSEGAVGWSLAASGKVGGAGAGIATSTVVFLLCVVSFSCILFIQITFVRCGVARPRAPWCEGRSAFVPRLPGRAWAVEAKGPPSWAKAEVSPPRFRH